MMSREIPDLPIDELDEVYQNVMKLELVVDAVRSVVGKGLLPDEKEHLILTMNPSEIGEREFAALGLTGSTTSLRKEPVKRNIPALKGLVEKELEQTYKLLQDLEKTTSSINGKEEDVPSKVVEIQSKTTAVSDEIHNSYKCLKTLLGLHARDAASGPKNSLETLTVKVNDEVQNLRNMESSILHDIFGEAREEHLEQIANDLEKELQTLTTKCEVMKEELEKYDENREEFLKLAKQLSNINKEIEVKQAALGAFL